MSKQFYFKQINLAWIRSLNAKISIGKEPRFSSIQPIDKTLIRCYHSGQNGAGSDGNKGILRILQSSIITGTSPSDCLVSYPGHTLGWGSYPSVEVQSVYSTAPADWATQECREKNRTSIKEWKETVEANNWIKRSKPKEIMFPLRLFALVTNKPIFFFSYFISSYIFASFKHILNFYSIVM